MKVKTQSFLDLLKNTLNLLVDHRQECLCYRPAKIRNTIFTILFLAFYTVVGFSVFAEGVNTRETITVSINGNRLEVADTPVKRQVGLMYRESMPENSGMLFVFPDEDFKTFWMKNTYIPLSIAYFTSDKVLVDIYDMKPNQTSEVYPSTKKITYALEVNQGWLEKRKIKKGARLILSREVSGI